jgi:hypothetical protein
VVPIPHFVNTVAGSVPKIGTLKWMMEAVKLLDEVSAGVSTFLHLVNWFDSHICEHQNQNNWQPVVTGSSTSNAMVEERYCEICESLAYFSIVGVGDMEKSTLAQSEMTQIS